MFGLLRRLFGTKNDRILRKYRHLLTEHIHRYAKEYQNLSLADLEEQWQLFRSHWNTIPQDHRQARTFAFVQRFSEIILGQKHYDVQLIGGLALCDGHVTEMATGEGKTLTATTPAIYQALEGQKVFVVTVNDYLAHRDATWMKPLYEALGLSVGIVLSDSSWEDKKQAYACSIIYVTNHRLGFDYLEDRTAMRPEEKLLPSLDFALIDEVDSILIDEARLPLITSAIKPQDLSLYPKLAEIVKQLSLATDPLDPESGDFSIDHRLSQVLLSDRGHAHVEDILHKEGLLELGKSLYDPQYSELQHLVISALRALHLYHRDRQYLVIDQKVVLVNEHTGRLSPGQRLAEGLHQSIEAKEQVPVQQETVTIASITYQNFFKLFKKIAGMTGTADTEAQEFHEIYQLEVVVIPTNRPVIRKDLPDLIFVNQHYQELAIIEAIKEHHALGRPVLVGTRSIDRSEHLSLLLKKEQIPHVVLNAKNHLYEAQIVAQAGTFGAVTIATNMAGRGTDVILGGSFKRFQEKCPDLSLEDQRNLWLAEQDKIRAIGGLQVIGCERNDSRRIDLQLRGRAGRQGDPGTSQFYVSFEDQLLKVLPQKLVEIVKYYHPEPHLPISDSMMDKRIAEFQKAKEGLHFDARKHSLEDDNVINDQRKVIYACRDHLLHSDDLHSIMAHYCQEVAHQFLAELRAQTDSEVAKKSLILFFQKEYEIAIDSLFAEQRTLDQQAIHLGDLCFTSYKNRIAHLDPDKISLFEKDLLLRQLDWLWRDHLMQLESIKQQVSLRGYAQKDPKQEYRIEAFRLFERLMAHYARQIVHVILKARFVASSSQKDHDAQKETPVTPDSNTQDTELAMETKPKKRSYSIKMSKETKSRNELCSCDSGKKYKHCCGALEV